MVNACDVARLLQHQQMGKVSKTEIIIIIIVASAHPFLLAFNVVMVCTS